LPFLAIYVLTSSGCSKRDQEPNPIVEKKPPTDADKKVIPKKPEPDFSLASERYAEAYEADRDASRKKYEGKLIQLTGRILDVGRTTDDTDFLRLEGGKTNVFCAPKEKEAWKKVFPGQTLTIVGIGGDGIPVPSLGEAEILEVRGARPTKISAAELAKEYVADSAAVVKKYDGEYHFLTGEVSKVEKTDFGGVKLWFKGEESAPRVRAGFDQFGAGMTKAILPGQRITVLGRLGFLKDELGTDLSVLIDAGK
jgi:hypothetical protein